MSGPTLADIAYQAGVSQATVSRVLNDKPGVSSPTRQCVLTALDVLGYQRPTHLKPVATGLVGLIVPELTNPVFANHAQAIETLLSREGYATAVCTQAPPVACVRTTTSGSCGRVRSPGSSSYRGLTPTPRQTCLPTTNWLTSDCRWFLSTATPPALRFPRSVTTMYLPWIRPLRTWLG